MAMNKQRRTANLNNVLTYDSIGNSTIISNLTVEGLTNAGFVKADINGLLSVDINAYITLNSGLTGFTVGSATEVTAADTVLQAFGKIQGQLNAIPDVNVITGTGVTGRVSYWSGTSTQSGSNNFFWDATNNRLGINTNTPTNSLHIIGTSLITGNANFEAVQIIKNGATIVAYIGASSLISGGSATTLEIRNATGDSSIYVAANNNIGISKANPVFKLDVSGTLGVSGVVTLSNLAGAGTRILVTDASGNLSTQPTSTYLTSLTGEATNSGTVVTLTNSAVIGKVLTGVNISSGSITASDSVLSAFGKLQGQIDGLQGGTVYKGSWNAATNTPTIVSSTGNQGDYYVVTTAGTTNINGVSSWAVGDWIIFNGTVWEKIPNVDSITSVNGQYGAVVLTTANITESGNLYYTDTRARNAISLTTTGTSGAATYGSGVLNIPNYSLAGLGGVATSRTLTINGVALDLSTNRSWSVGTVTSVNATVPTGFTVGATVTSSGNIDIGFDASYSLPTTASQANWNASYNDRIVSAAVTGTTTKTLTLNQQDSGTITATWTDINTDAVTSVFGRTGAVVAVGGDYTTSLVTEGTNLYYTEARVNANSNVAANTAARHNAVTLGTANGLSLSTQVLSLVLASTSTTGALSSTDWNTFNSKQNALTNPVTGTGTNNYIAKFTGASSVGNSIMAESAGLMTIYGDGQVYKGQSGTGLTNFYITNDDTSFGNRHETKISTQQLGSGLARTIIQAASNTTTTNRGELSILTESGANYVANIGTIITGGDNAFSIFSTSFIENIRLNSGGNSFLMGGNLGVGSQNPDARLRVAGTANSTQAIFGNVDGRGLAISTSVISGTNEAGVILNARSSVTAGTFIFQTDGTERMRLNSSGSSVTGAATFSSSVTAASLVRTGGTSAQILAADGSVITAGTNITISGGVISSTGGISGSGTANTITKWTSGTAVGNSQIVDNGTNVGVGTLTPSEVLHVLGNILAGNGGVFKIMNSSLANVTVIRAANGGASVMSSASWGNNIAIGTETANDLILASNNTERIRLKSDGFLQHINATNPSASLIDSYFQYSNDVVAGNAAPHFRTENGAVIKLYQETTGVGNAIFSQGSGNALLDDSTFAGYTLRQIVQALRNQGLLQ